MVLNIWRWFETCGTGVANLKKGVSWVPTLVGAPSARLLACVAKALVPVNKLWRLRPTLSKVFMACSRHYKVALLLVAIAMQQ